jgi:hypothetical protein
MRLQFAPAILILAALPATAATQYHSSQASFDAASPGLTYNTFAPPLSGSSPALFVDDASGTGIDFRAANTGIGSTQDVAISGTQLRTTVGGSGTRMIIDIPNTVLAIGFNITITGSVLKAYCVEAADTTACDQGLGITPGVNTLVGFTRLSSDPAFGSIQIRQTGSAAPLLAFIDFAAGVDSGGGPGGGEAPEPSTLAMFGCGLAALGFIGRRKRA